ncbi:uncharacterized protein LOC106051678 [Biomphalaria glabrata]|uniref:Uncharacterized protein LOC106051678 n=1 Tax=Biomphalaria glabrata TaxID=6526 RepID=A0A9W2ZF71_BIOGL|nr:uncharacterized protein LOC106051678 [Biomphalaria glabrata]
MDQSKPTNIDSRKREGGLAYELNTDGLRNIKFGKEIRDKEFLLDPDVTFLNHGSYGTVPSRIIDIQNKLNIERERHPDHWYRVNCKKYVDRSRRAVADFIGADSDNIVYVSNPSVAINTVIRSYPFQPGDALLDTNLSYGTIAKLCKDFTSRIRPDVERVNLQIDFPVLSEDYIIQKYEDILRKHPNIKVAIIDHITSPSAIVMPVKKLVDLCHSNNVLAFIDGAHAIGQIPLNINDLGADVYTTSVHKWAFAPRGCAILWYDRKHASWINPLTTSWNIGDSLDQQFFEQGTVDHIPYVLARHCLDFYQAIGGMSKIIQYTTLLAEEARDLLIKELRLEPLPLAPTLESPNLKLLKLPAVSGYPCTEAGVAALEKALFEGTSVFAVLALIQNHIYLRYSVQVYNDIDDFKTFVTYFKDFLHKSSDSLNV